jgi:16S rRNA (guanine527-N7)-methyltransferase
VPPRPRPSVSRENIGSLDGAHDAVEKVPRTGVFHVKTPGLPALGERYGLDAGKLDRLEALLVVADNDAHAPTAVHDVEQAVDVHVADSLVALELAPVRTARAIADLGSGSGFPGLALAVALPRVEVNLVESQRRKCEYLERVRAASGVANASVVCARVEEWRAGIEANDLVVARALAAQSVVLEYAAPLLRVGGVLVDWRGRRSPGEEEVAERAAGQLGLRRLEIRHVEPYADAREHHLHVFEKATPTPPRFPRRPGAARKRPLGR